MTATEVKPLEVELPVCPECLKVGPQPKHAGRVSNACTGGVHNPHPRRSMEYRPFREIRVAA